MKNKILIGLTCLFVLICTVGCANTKENTSVKNDNIKSDTEQTVKSKCSYYECLTKMSLDNTLEELKSSNQMLWISKMNNIKNMVEEIILKEYIYV